MQVEEERKRFEAELQEATDAANRAQAEYEREHNDKVAELCNDLAVSAKAAADAETMVVSLSKQLTDAKHGVQTEE